MSWPCALQGTGHASARDVVGLGNAGGWDLPVHYVKRVSGLRHPLIQHPRAVPPWHGSFLGSSFSSRESSLWLHMAVMKWPHLPMPLGAAGEGRDWEAPSQSSVETEAAWDWHDFWRVYFHLHKIASHKRQQHREKRMPMITSLYLPGSWMVCWTATTTDCARDWEVG